jgi:hypothetical protein
MNFKTTLILLVVLAGLGAFIFFTGSKPETAKTDTEVSANERRLFDAKPEDITKISVVASDGKRTVLEKSGATWKLTEPVSAAAEAFEVDALARALAELKSHGRVTDSSAASGTGLAAPQYKVEFTTKDDKTTSLSVGDKSAVGDNLYVSTGGSSQAEVVNTALLEQLEKPANTYRNPKLVSLPSAEVKQLTIKRPDATITLEKIGSEWRMNEPKKFAVDAAEVDDILFAVTGLRATDWVAENTADAKQYQLDNPRVTVTLSSTTKPTTQVTSTAPASGSSASTQPVTIKIGRYDDVLRKNVLATSSDGNAVAKVAATIVETLNKKPIEFRDKRVLQIAAADVSGIVMLSDVPATTQPTTKPASKKELILQRHEATLPVGIAAPSTKASTKPTTVAATAPAPATQAATKPANKWDILTTAGGTEPAEDSRIDELLFQLNPFRADKYLESAPATTQPAPTYTLKITTQGPGGVPPEQQTITITDPGQGKAPIATYNDLTFEVPRTLLEKLDADYKKGSAAAQPRTPTPGFPEAP